MADSDLVKWERGMHGDLEKWKCWFGEILLHSVVHSGRSGNHAFKNDRGADSCGYTQWEQSWEINNQNSAPCLLASEDLYIKVTSFLWWFNFPEFYQKYPNCAQTLKQQRIFGHCRSYVIGIYHLRFCKSPSFVNCSFVGLVQFPRIVRRQSLLRVRVSWGGWWLPIV